MLLREYVPVIYRKEPIVEPAPSDDCSGTLTSRALGQRIRQQELLAVHRNVIRAKKRDRFAKRSLREPANV